MPNRAAQGGQHPHWPHQRPSGASQWRDLLQTLPRHTAPRRLFRRRDQQDLRIPDQQLSLPALTICALYRQRWQVELFFIWIKQHLRIKSFFGTNENAVKTQIWVAISTYVLIAIVKKKLHLNHSMHEILRVLSLNMVETAPIPALLKPSFESDQPTLTPIQGNLFQTLGH